MVDKPSPVRLQLLLRGDGRDRARQAALEQALRSMGLELTAHGTASATARADPETFSRVFSAAADPATELTVPERLREFVHSITIAPSHEYFDPSDKTTLGGL